MNISHLEEYSFIYGPGCRYIIWVQGCSIKCKGCWNKEMWSFKQKNDITIDQLLDKILKEKEFVEGITILGGEPFDQYSELLQLLILLQKEDLSVIVYTGYEKEELIAQQYTAAFKHIDILISGRYDENFRTLQAGLIGSSNQKINFLSNKYNLSNLTATNEVEISINPSGKINIYGYPDETIIK